MARVTFDKGTGTRPFAAQSNNAAISKIEGGLTWKADLNFPYDGQVILETVGGSQNGKGEPVGTASAFSLKTPGGDLLFAVQGVNVSIKELLAGVPNGGPHADFWPRLFEGADVMVGSAIGQALGGYEGNDTLYGRGGNDSLYGDRGSDVLDGGAGSDLASFRGGDIFRGVIDLLKGTAIFGDDVDILRSIENVEGSNQSDVIKGSNQANILRGGAGKDVIYGRSGDDTLMGGDRADTLDGGKGFDTADFSDWSHGLSGGVINLSTGRAVLGDSSFQQTDVLRSIEFAVGTDYNDTIVGTLNANKLWGGDGDDQIFGGRGFDTVYGGDGDDVLQGGEKADTLFGDEGDDYLNGGRHDDILEGGVGDDGLYGSSGHDVLRGGEGDDVLNGGSGFDTLSGGLGENRLIGDAGHDVFLIGSGTDFVSTGRNDDVLRVVNGGGTAVVSDFNVNADRIELDVAGKTLPSVDQLISSGRLTITGDAEHTLLTFGQTTIDLDNVAFSGFDLDLITVV
ncbi:calcium-binding protein [Hansschlegelia sp. KR7-227]|uniref:calcium-binding protein n=1 Tax=Hansschlegelia sp. KR7-227 TaxID=3400914 RepID=UPI003C047F45